MYYLHHFKNITYFKTKEKMFLKSAEAFNSGLHIVKGFSLVSIECHFCICMHLKEVGAELGNDEGAFKVATLCRQCFFHQFLLESFAQNQLSQEEYSGHIGQLKRRPSWIYTTY